MLNYLTNIYYELTKEKVKWIIIFFCIGVLGLLVCYPIGILFWKSLLDKAGNFTINNYAAVITNPGLFSSLKNSLILGTFSALLSTLIGLPMAFAVGRTNMPLKKLITAMVLVSFVIPSFIQAIAWILLLGPRAGLINTFLRDTLHLPLTLNIFGMSGLVFVITLNNYPFVYYSVLASLNNIDPAYEEASRMAGAKTWKTAIGISLPLVSPALIMGIVLTFLHSIAALGAPQALALPARFHVLTTRIYELFSYPPRYELAAACAIPIVLLTVIGLLLQKFFLGRKQFHSITGKTSHPEPFDVGKWKYIFLGFSLMVILVTVILPTLVLIRTSFTKLWGLPLTIENFSLANYRHIFDPSFTALKSIENSFIVGIVTATICVILSIVIVWMGERGKVKGRGLLGFLCMITFSFPSSALAVGILLAFMVSPFNLQGTLTIMILGFISKLISYAYVLTGNTMKQIHPEFEEASRVIGASWSQSIKDISIPLLKPGLFVAWILVFAAALRELSMAMLLYFPGNQTMAVSIFTFLDNGKLEGAATLSLILAILSVAAVFIVRKVVGKSVMEI